MKTCPLCETTYPNQQTNCPIDGARLIESRNLEPGTVIRGKYRIVRVLGRGGMGTVYLAEHILLGHPRALKFISAELSQDAAFLRRFRREAQAAIKLRHPNIVEVVDLDQAEDGSPYIAMEFVDGPDLRRALEGRPIAVERALAIARGIAQGLAAAHAKGIVHRDVKPENILLEGGNGTVETPKLLDFGISAMKESATAISRTRGLMLTPEYAAPEQWKGMAAEELDGRTDLYALGGVLHEMLTGSTSFHSHNTEGWMFQHLMAEPAAPSSLRPELANWPGLDALAMRLLAKDREQRPRDAGELICLLQAVHCAVPLARWETVREEPPLVIRRATDRKDANLAPSPSSKPAPENTAGLGTEKGIVRTRGTAKWLVLAVLAAVAIIAVLVVANWPISPPPSAYNDSALHTSTNANSESTGLSPAHVANPRPPIPPPDDENSIREAISKWVDAFRSRDSSRLASSYAPMVEKYFLKENVSREQVEQNIESAFSHTENVRIYQVDSIRIEMSPSENDPSQGITSRKAAATLHKVWEMSRTNGKTFSGEEIEKLTFVSSSDGWKIIREEELNIIRVSNR
jgi:serine/threonine protein kinase